jgi:hypothetical protein
MDEIAAALQIHIIGSAFGLGVSSCSFLAISMEVKYFQELQHCIAKSYSFPLLSKSISRS